MENGDAAAAGSGAASLEGIRVLSVDPIHLQTMTQTQVFSGDQAVEMVRRGGNGGPCGFLTKPLGDDVMHNICLPVKQRSLNAAVNAASANTYPHCSHVVRQDGMSRKRPIEGDHSDEGGSDSRTTKKINFPWTEKNHALLHKVANNQLNGIEDNTQKNISELLEHDSVSATMAQVSSHPQKYKTDHPIDQLSTIPTASPSYSNNSWKKYSTSQDSEGSSGLNMRYHGARNLNQISRLSGSASPVGLGVLGNGSNTTGLGGAAIRGATSSTGNGNANGYGYRYGSGNTNSSCNLNNNGHGYDYTDGSGGHGGVLTDGIMASASLPSNLAQPVQQTNEIMPTSNLFPSNTVHAMDNPNHIRQQELVPRLYRLSYDCRNGGISMLPWPQDDGTADPLRRYQGENEVMENTTTMDMTDGIQNAATMNMPQGMQTAAIGETTKEMLGDGPASQTRAVQPQGLGGQFFNWESTTFETAGTSGGEVVTNETLDWPNPDEFENLMNPRWSEL